MLTVAFDHVVCILLFLVASHLMGSPLVILSALEKLSSRHTQPIILMEDVYYVNKTQNIRPRRLHVYC